MNATDEREAIVSNIKETFQSVGLNIPFYIAGGWVFSTVTEPLLYKDIQVFLYNKEDLLLLLKVYFGTDDIDHIVNTYYFSWDSDIIMITESLLVIQSNNFDAIQISLIDIGQPEDIFKTFDLNIFKIAVDSNFNLIKDKSFSKDIICDFHNFNSDTVFNYGKFISLNGVTDYFNETYFLITLHLIKNFEKQTSSLYNCYAPTNKLLLKDMIRNVPKRIQNVVHDQICYNVQKDKVIDLFLYLGSCFYCLDWPSDEFIASTLISKSERNYLDISKCTKREKSIMMKYSEYFI